MQNIGIKNFRKIDTIILVVKNTCVVNVCNGQREMVEKST